MFVNKAVQLSACATEAELREQVRWLEQRAVEAEQAAAEAGRLAAEAALALQLVQMLAAVHAAARR